MNYPHKVARTERGNRRGGATKVRALFTHFLIQKYTPLSISLPQVQRVVLLSSPFTPRRIYSESSEASDRSLRRKTKSVTTTTVASSARRVTCHLRNDGAGKLAVSEREAEVTDARVAVAVLT